MIEFTVTALVLEFHDTPTSRSRLLPVPVVWLNVTTFPALLLAALTTLGSPSSVTAAIAVPANARTSASAKTTTTAARAAPLRPNLGRCTRAWIGLMFGALRFILMSAPSLIAHH